MTGSFELFEDQYGRFRFRITAPDGTVMALSRDFPDKRAAVAGIEAVREYAGMGLITDQCPKIPLRARDAEDHKPSTEDKHGTTVASPDPAFKPARQTVPHLIGRTQAPQRRAALELAGAVRRPAPGHPH